MTPYYNHRTDKYGSTTENRARMSLETFDKIKDAVGNDYPILMKINVNDGIKDGVDFNDVLYLCSELDKRKIDSIEISGSWQHLKEGSTSYFKKEADIISAKYNTKIILTGGNTNINEMTEILNKTKVEYFGIARNLLKQPDLINQYKTQLTKE
jgi:2,4-dienoyl-CoA reductase-like NADH-dependent reductase (Old Yellow Enzyme family)